MENSNGHATTNTGLSIWKSVRLWALVIAFTMIATPFFAVVSSADTPPPTIWTSKDEYAPGETVYIYGEGFVPYIDLTLNLTHPDIGTKSFVVTPVYGGMYDGGVFTFDDYVAEPVSSYDPVVVTATQVVADGVLVATTQFWDPAAYLEGYTLKPQQRFTTGDIKGYIEDDSVPFIAVLNKAQLGGVSNVQVTIGVDMIDINSPTQPIYGIDYLTDYWLESPSAPFNMYPNSSEPFYVDPSEGTITDQERLPNQVDEGNHQVIQVWRFDFTFDPSAKDATIRFGAHLALTDLASDFLGASYYPGSALHVRMVDLVPPSNEGNRDVPIALGTVLTPPDVNVEKECDPTLVVEGDVITFTIHWNNTGQASAHITMEDWLDDVADLVPGSFLFWTSENPTPMPLSPGPTVTGNDFVWTIGLWRGTGVDDSLPPLEGYLQFQGTVNTNEPGCYYNRVYLNYTDDHGGVYPMEYAECMFYIIAEPSIDVEKMGPLYAHVDETIEYTYTVTNTGDVDLFDVVVDDDVVGLIDIIGTLAVGETRTYTVEYTVTESDPDHLYNEVTATGDDDYGRTTSDSDSWEVDILHPMIDVTKEADKTCGEVDETITYTITVENPSTDTTLYDVIVEDSVLGIVWSGITLAPGQWDEEIISYTITEFDDDPLVNYVTAYGEDITGWPASDEASHTVDIYHPMIEVTKEADVECAGVGETITYWIYVYNPSWDTKMYFELWDLLISPNMLGSGWIDPYETIPFGSYYYVVPQGVEWVDNTAYVDAWDEQGHYVYDQSTVSVEILHPMVDVQKTSEWECAAEGELVYYTVTVTNTGDTPLWGTVTDSLLGWSETFADLGVGQSISWDVSMIMPAGDVFINTVDVQAYDKQDHPASDSDEWEIDLRHPAIDIEKSADVGECAAVGDTIVYTIVVSNPSPDTTMYYDAYDLMLDWSASGELGPGDSDSFRLMYMVDESTPDPLINEAYVFAYDDQYMDAVEWWLHYAEDSDSWTIDIYHAMIDVEKWADVGECAAIGDTIVYTIVVSNPSDDTWMNYEVEDEFLGWSASGYLAPLGSYTYYVEYVVNEKTPDPLINEVYVFAWDDQYDHTSEQWNHMAEDWDIWTIDILHAAIDVEKSADVGECAAIGDTIVYTIVVSNPSDDTWMNYYVEDPMLEWSASGYLAPGGSDTYTVTYLVTELTPDPLINEVYVFGWDDQYYTSDDWLNHYAEDWDSWWIDILHPAIDVEKWADVGECAAIGDTITYTIVVSNPSDDTWMNYYVEDPMLEWSASGYLAPGGSNTYYVYYLVTELTPDPLINEVYVHGWDDQYRYSSEPENHEAFDWDGWWIDILHVAIDVDKWADVGNCAGIGDLVTYTIVVSNPSIDTPVSYELYDSMLQWGVSGYLAPGGSDPYTLTYEVTEQTPDPLINLVEAWAYDDQYWTSQEWWNHYAYDSAEWYIDIVHPAVDIEKFSYQYYAHAGDTIYYEIWVWNTGDIELTGTVTDATLGLVVPFSGLVPGGYLTIYADYTVMPGEEWVYNEASVDAYDRQGHNVYDMSWWEVEIIYPDIDVTKTGPDYATVGETITYYVTVTNTGDTTLYDVDLYDTLLGTYVAYFASLAPGESRDITYDYVVPPGAGTVDNTVYAWGWDIIGGYVEDDASWTVLKYGKVDGYKFADLDRDGVYDKTEPGIANWLIILEGPMGTETALTDSEGYYQFPMLIEGNYVLSEEILDGWYATLPTSVDLTIGSGSAYSVDFGNVPEGSISGAKWEDEDLDGVWDVGELGVPGWTIKLDGMDANGDEIHLTTTTDGAGEYSFTGLLPGVYTVSEEAVAGWMPMTPMSVTLDLSTLEPFEVTDVDFGNAKLGQITGYKWLEIYMNGIWDAGVWVPGWGWLEEPPLSGWTIMLTGTLANGEPFGPVYTTTDENGYYHFDDLLPGVYVVEEIIPEDWTHITPYYYEVTIGEGDVVFCAKFGNVNYSKIDGWKFLDWDMDEIKDGNEPGIEGWAITLEGLLLDGEWGDPYFPFGTPVGPITIYTDHMGYWAFEDLLPGVYWVTEESREGWYHTTDDSYTTFLMPGSYVFDIKFGNVPYTCVWGYKFNDLDGDGVWDEGEPALPGWTIVLEGWTNAGEYVYIEMVTDGDGYYETCFNVLPGEYVLYEMGQEGWIQTLPEEVYFVIPRMVDEPQTMRFDFGNFKLGKVFGWKYEDMNGNGILDAGDVPIQGWEITIEGGHGPYYLLDSTTTDVNGYYEFSGLPYGDYTITEESRAGWVHMTESFFDVTIMSGSVIELPPFLNVELSKIYGYKFEDLNSNGVWDEGEPAIPGWTIYMIWDEDDTVYITTTNENGYYEFAGLMPDEYYYVWEEDREGWTPTTDPWEVVTVVSGSCIRIHDFGNFENVDIWVFKFEDLWHDGYYDQGYDTPLEGWEFTVYGPGLPGGVAVIVTGPDGYASVEVTEAGEYLVVETPVEGWCPTTPTEQIVDVISGIAEPEVVPFGNFECVLLTFFKYEDVNSDGEYEEGVDEPIPGWTIYVLDLMTGTMYVLETDINGLATVEICYYAYLEVREELPEDWCTVTPEYGVYYIEVVSGHAYDMTMQQYEERYFYPFGNFECVVIEVFKYWDTCSNGWYDPGAGDEPIEGWWIGLFDAAGMLLYEDYTDSSGHVYFTICHAGVYYVVEENREGWSHITPLSGMYEVEVLSGDGVITLWFGNYLDVDVPIFKYNDLNSNGVWDKGEPGLEDWYFEMTRAGDDVTYSGYTDHTGNLVLTVNRSGIYTIVEEDKEGWTHVNPENGMRLVNIVSGIEVPTQMFGNFHNVSIVVFKFDDIMADGRYEPQDDDVPIAGWLMSLYIWDGDEWVFVESKLTDESGEAVFWLTAAGLYKVEEEAREGWIWISPEDGYYLFEIHSCMDPIRAEFANFKLGKIFGYKFEDLNGNGEWDEGEPGLPGWTIWFEGGGGAGGYLTGYDVTDENGYYEFTGLPPGTYDVWEEVQAGWEPTSPPEVEDVEIRGHSEVRIDFLNFELGCIWGYKFEDMNGNGVYDDGDLPLPGWTIYLSITTGVVDGPDGSMSAIMLIATTTTDGDGFYSFCGLGPGIYVVDEESRTGWIHTTDPSETVVMTSGASIRIHDFLNFELGRICGYKFEDLNSNGIWDAGEPAIEGWAIYMIRASDDGTEVRYTNENGWFCFSGLEADLYLVWEEQPEGWTPTTTTYAEVTITSGLCFEIDPFGNFENVWIDIFKYEDFNGNGVYDNGDVPIEDWEFTVTGPAFVDPLVVYTGYDGWAYVEVTKAGTYTVTEEDRDGWMHTVPESGSYTVEVSSGVVLKALKFGNFMLGEIAGLKFYDWNMNGIKDEGEAGLAGWVVWINGTLVGGGYLNFTRITDSSGEFSVGGLPAGTYVVSERFEYAPAGWWPTTDPTVVVDIASGAAESVEFGNTVTGIIWGYKFYDKDQDGLWDEEEPGLCGWTIVLEGVTDQGVYVYREAVTDEDGYYEFDLVSPGSYEVYEILWMGWTATTTLPVIVDVSGTMVYFEVVVNIGNIRYAIIHGYKFLDTYEEKWPYWPNGIFDGDEFGLGNWEITLQGWTETGEWVDRVTYTDNSDDVGYYEFTEVLPGTYWVNETLLEKWYATRPISNLIMVYPYPNGMVNIVIDFGNTIPEPDPEIRFVLHKGWNLWSSPIALDGMMASDLLEEIGLDGASVWKLDKAAEKWVMYMKGDAPERDFAIEFGEGYYILVSTDVSFTLFGTLVPQSEKTLGAGWNVVGYNTLRPTTASSFLSMVEGSNPLIVVYLDEETGLYEGYVIGDSLEYDFNVVPGRAYFLWVDAAGTLVYPSL